MPKENRRRAFTGCVTCRRRRVRCDEKRPVCDACSRIGSHCEGYGPRLVWGDESRNPTEASARRRAHRATEYRYPLFAEPYRQRLVLRLTESLARQSPSDAIADIDEWQGLAGSGNESSFMKGPFGVVSMRIRGVDDSYSGTSSTPSEGTTTPPDSTVASSIDPYSYQTMEQGESIMCVSEGYASDPFIPSSPSPRSRGQLLASNQLLHQLEPLLRYFDEYVIRPISNVQNTRISPWRELFWPCALAGYGQVKLWNSAPPLQTIVLYSVLAISASHLQISQGSNVGWKSLSITYLSKARHLTCQVLNEHTSSRATPFEYSELLKAILSVAMAVLFSRAELFKGYLVAAEYVIRTWVKREPNSEKTSMLHHMYTHLRILAEATCTFADCISDFGDLQNQALSPARVPEFRVGDYASHAEATANILVENTESADDIHLEECGREESRLYSAIFGVPRSLMSLLSRIVALANEKVALKTPALAESNTSSAIEKYSKTVETALWSWHMPEKTFEQGIQELSLLSFSLSADGVDVNLSRAMYQAVIIYFYRRVYDADAMVLQERVKTCLHNLELCLGDGIDDRNYATTIAWVAYVASCGAVIPDLRTEAIRLLKRINRRAVILTAEPAEQIAKFWENRLKRGQDTLDVN